jgi:putative methionine-R-sulfoxide reductase with GAF domain
VLGVLDLDALEVGVYDKEDEQGLLEIVRLLVHKYKNFGRIG